jgi:hypothetical protein
MILPFGGQPHDRSGAMLARPKYVPATSLAQARRGPQAPSGRSLTLPPISNWQE